MIHRVLNYLKSEKNIDEAYLSVRIRNYPARNAYKKLGGTEIAHKKIFRICRIQIPFHGYTL
jgi:RimJ/RimL family protein N-acetyltransferase